MLARTLAVALAALVVAPAAASADWPAPRIIRALNAERHHDGLPANVTLQADWSAKCAKHNAYEHRNNVLSHPEDPSLPGYTADGNWAGLHSVLAVGALWANGDPWETAPYHLLQVLDPGLRQSGISERWSYDCLTTWPGSVEPTPAQDRIYSWPGNGVTDAMWQEVASELPSVPGQVVGLPQGVRTGPNIMVWWVGPASADQLTDLVAGRVTGPKGAVAARIVNDRNDQTGLTGEGRGFIIPVHPLRPGTTYHASATFSSHSGARKYTGAFSFRTKPIPPPSKLLWLARPYLRSGQVHFDIHAAPELEGTKATCTFIFPGGYPSKSACQALNGSSWYAPPPAHGQKMTFTIRTRATRVGGVRIGPITASRTYTGR